MACRGGGKISLGGGVWFPEGYIDPCCAGACDSRLQSCLAGAGASLEDLLPEVEKKILATAAAEPVKLLKQVIQIQTLFNCAAFNSASLVGFHGR